MKSKTKKKIVKSSPEIVKAPNVLTVKSAGLVNGEFVVVLSNGDFLGKVEEVSTKKVGYGNGVYVHIFCEVDTTRKEPSTPISEKLTNTKKA